MVFGVLSTPDPLSSSSSTPNPPTPNFTLEPPSPWAKRTPFVTHPAKCPETPPRIWWAYKPFIKLADDPAYREKYLGVPREGMEWGCYLTLVDKEDRVTTPGLAFMADTFRAVDQIRTEGEIRKVRKTR